MKIIRSMPEKRIPIQIITLIRPQVPKAFQVTSQPMRSMQADPTLPLMWMQNWMLPING